MSLPWIHETQNKQTPPKATPKNVFLRHNWSPLFNRTGITHQPRTSHSTSSRQVNKTKRSRKNLGFLYGKLFRIADNESSKSRRRWRPSLFLKHTLWTTGLNSLSNCAITAPSLSLWLGIRRRRRRRYLVDVRRPPHDLSISKILQTKRN